MKRNKWIFLVCLLIQTQFTSAEGAKPYTAEEINNIFGNLNYSDIPSGSYFKREEVRMNLMDITVRGGYTTASEKTGQLASLMFMGVLPYNERMVASYREHVQDIPLDAEILSGRQYLDKTNPEIVEHLIAHAPRKTIDGNTYLVVLDNNAAYQSRVKGIRRDAEKLYPLAFELEQMLKEQDRVLAQWNRERQPMAHARVIENLLPRQLAPFILLPLNGLKILAFRLVGHFWQ